MRTEYINLVENLLSEEMCSFPMLSFSMFYSANGPVKRVRLPRLPEMLRQKAKFGTGTSKGAGTRIH